MFGISGIFSCAKVEGEGEDGGEAEGEGEGEGAACFSSMSFVESSHSVELDRRASSAWEPNSGLKWLNSLDCLGPVPDPVSGEACAEEEEEELEEAADDRRRCLSRMRKKREMHSDQDDRGRMSPLRKTRRVEEGGKAVMSGESANSGEDEPGNRAEMERVPVGLWGRVTDMFFSCILGAAVGDWSEILSVGC